MRLADHIERAVCITIPGRWPGGYEAVRGQFAARGVDVTAVVNGPLDRLPPPDDRVPAGYECLANTQPPPASFWGVAGSWWHRLAFRRIVERARQDGVRSLLIVEDDARFVREADAILDGVEVPPDWRLLYLGGMHNWAATADAGPNVVRTYGARAIHAVVYHRDCFEDLLALPPEGPVDHEIAERLHARLPCYAVWPSAVIQGENVSTMTGRPSAGPDFYGDRGVTLAG